METKLIVIIIVGVLVVSGASGGLYLWLRGGKEEKKDGPPHLESPVAVIEASATRIIENETVFFNSSKSIDPDGEIVIYIWDFGDGGRNETNSTNVSHRYEIVDPEGEPYNVTLTVIDDNSQDNSTSINITVIPRCHSDNAQVFLLSRENPRFADEMNVSFEKHPFNANCTFNITLTGASLSLDITANLTLEIYDPDSQMILTKDYDVTGEKEDNINLSFEELEKTGEYNIKLACGKGTVRVIYTLEVKYW